MDKTLRLTDKTLRLTDRLVDISFCGLSASLYCAHTVQLTAIMEDMEDFFTYLVLSEIADRTKAGYIQGSFAERSKREVKPIQKITQLTKNATRAADDS